MKKHKKSKTLKHSTKKAGKAENEMPSLVVVMTKLVERFEGLEKKIDLVLSRTSTTVFAGKEPLQLNAADLSQHRERVLYDAICADCCKSCRVPFRPSGGRPVYCPECFAIRKAGHKPKSPDELGKAAHSQKPARVFTHTAIETLPAAETTVFPGRRRFSKKKKGKPAKKAKKKK